MKFYSTNGISPKTSLKEAVLSGTASDSGLYMPQSLPGISRDYFKKAKRLPFDRIALDAASEIFKNDIPENELSRIITDAFNFDLPLVQLEENKFILELFHGPTCAFKDFGARFMARVFSYLLENSRRELTVLVATSGDTGSAVAHGFYNVPGIKVVILYPSGKISDLQEKQLTTMGGNVAALEVNGSFDDCQALVKAAFSDRELRSSMMLASANSINVARLLPQLFYYLYTASRLADDGKELVVSVPSGNFGNLTAGLFAKKMGAPIDLFVAATNANDVVPTYFSSGHFISRQSKKTISNAMDVGNPSNLSRMKDLYGNDISKLRRDVKAYSFTDESTSQAMCRVFKNSGYILDPHSAVAYLGLQKEFQAGIHTGVFLGTAHPAKFTEVVEKSIGVKPDIPDRLEKYLRKTKKSTPIDRDYDQLKDYLVRSYNSVSTRYSERLFDT